MKKLGLQSLLLLVTMLIAAVLRYYLSDYYPNIIEVLEKTTRPVLAYLPETVNGETAQVGIITAILVLIWFIIYKWATRNS